MEPKIYLVLSQTSSVLSAVIKVFTRVEFNHISISLSEDLESMWSFGRIRPYNPFVGGFVRERICEGTFLRFPKTRCEVYSLSITPEQKEAIKACVERMYQNRSRYRYNFIGLLFAIFKIDFYGRRGRRFYCTQFVKKLFKTVGIKGAEALPKISTPCDFARLPETEQIYRGLLKEYPLQKREASFDNV